MSGEACAIVSVPSLIGFDETLGSMSSPERWDVSEDHLLGIHNPSSPSIRPPISPLIGFGEFHFISQPRCLAWAKLPPCLFPGCFPGLRDSWSTAGQPRLGQISALKRQA